MPIDKSLLLAGMGLSPQGAVAPINDVQLAAFIASQLMDHFVVSAENVGRAVELSYDLMVEAQAQYSMYQAKMASLKTVQQAEYRPKPNSEVS